METLLSEVVRPFVLGVILARGGSRRVPRKNIKLLGERPLIAWTIEAAKQSKLLNAFLVSTDDDEIAEISKQYGAPVPFKRPAELGEDVDSVLPLAHAVQWYETTNNVVVTYVVCLQPTSPLRTGNDIDQCIQTALASNVDTVMSVVKVKQHPYWCFELTPFGHELKPFMEVDLEGDNLVSQNLPILFYPNGAVYVTKRDIIVEDQRIFGGSIYGYIMPEERSVDLEEETDFVYCSALMPWLKSCENSGLPKISWVTS
jgi:CMP-N,N'-diacetyllegionaminic acid synthase